MASRWYGLNVLAVEQFDDSMLCELFELASQLKTMVRTQGKCDLLRGKILANVFMEPSTRTMCSFDAAMKRLGGDVIQLNEQVSSAKKGESIHDTIRCLQCYCDALVIRHPVEGTAQEAWSSREKGRDVGERTASSRTNVRACRPMAPVVLTTKGTKHMPAGSGP